MSEVDEAVVADEDDDDRLGARFILKLTLIIAGIAVLVLIGMLVFFKAVYAWGFFGAFLLLAAALVVYGVVHDRRNPRAPRV